MRIFEWLLPCSGIYYVAGSQHRLTSDEYQSVDSPLISDARQQFHFHSCLTAILWPRSRDPQIRSSLNQPQMRRCRRQYVMTPTEPVTGHRLSANNFTTLAEKSNTLGMIELLVACFKQNNNSTRTFQKSYSHRKKYVAVGRMSGLRNRS